MNQHVQLRQYLGGGLDVSGVGEVQRPGGGAQRGGDVIKMLRRPTGEQQGVGGCQGVRDGGADTRAGPGDQSGARHVGNPTDPHRGPAHRRMNP